MILKVLKLVGYASFQDEVVFALDRKESLHLLKGDNGNGKTTLLSAIPWVIYGVSVKGLITDKVATWEEKRTLNFKGTRGIITMQDDKYKYMIIRHYKYKGKTFGITGASNLMFLKKGITDGSFTDADFTDARHKVDIQKEIDTVIGINSKAFMQSVFFAQKVMRLVEDSRDSNLKLFESILESEWVNKSKKKAGEEKNLLQTKISDFNNELGMLNTEIINIENILGEYERRISEFNADKKSELDILHSKITEHKNTVENLYKELKQVKASENKVKRLNDDLTSLHNKMNIIVKESKVSEYRENLNKFESNGKKEIDRLYNKYIQERDNSYDNKDLIAYEKTIRDLNSKIKHLGVFDGDNTFANKLANMDKELHVYNRDIKRYYEELSVAKDKKKSYENAINSTSSICTHCGQKLPENDINEHKNNLLTKVKNEETVIKVLSAKVNALVSERDVKGVLLDKEEISFRELEQKHVQNINDLKTSRDELIRKVDKLKEDLIKSAKLYEDEYNKYMLSYNKEYNKLLDVFNTYRDEYNEKVKHLESKITSCKADIESYLDVSDRIDELNSSILKYTTELNIYQENYNNLQDKRPPKYPISEKEKELNRLNIMFNKIDKLLKSTNKDLEDVSWWYSKGFGNSGIKAYIFASGLVDLNRYVVKYASKLGYNINFSVNMYKSNKDFKATISYIDIVNDEIVEYEKDYSEFSGGEQQKINIAISFAMYDLVARKFNSNILILDEVFEGLSKSNESVAFEIIREKVKDGKTVYVITHSDSVDSIYAKSIYINKNKNSSYIDNEFIQ